MFFPLFLFTGCPGVDHFAAFTDSDTGFSLDEETVWEGTVPGGGFGTRIVNNGTITYISAPYSAQIFLSFDGEQPVAAYDFPSASFGGSGLALVGDGVFAGAPLDGDGRIVQLGLGDIATGEGLGGVIAGSDDLWVASTRSGWQSLVYGSKELGRRPDSLAHAWFTPVVAGAAWGETALWLGDTAIPRQYAGDEAGYALLEWTQASSSIYGLLVGAPGEGAVYAFTSEREWIKLASSPGTRFGSAIAAGDYSRILIGAPGYGTEHQGAVFAYHTDTKVLDLVLEGQPGDELGTSIAVLHTVFFAGAPGGATSVGKVYVQTLPE